MYLLTFYDLYLTLCTSYLTFFSSFYLILHIPYFELHHIKFLQYIIPFIRIPCLCMVNFISFPSLYVIIYSPLSVGSAPVRALENTLGFLQIKNEKSIKPKLYKFMSVVKLPAKTRTYTQLQILNIKKSRICNRLYVMSSIHFFFKKRRGTKKQENIIHRKKENINKN